LLEARALQNYPQYANIDNIGN